MTAFPFRKVCSFTPCALLLVYACILPFYCRAATSLPAASLFERHTYQVWNTSTGLPQDTVRQFLQTRDGYLWMATDGGLVRFDGFDFVTFDRRNTLAMQSDLVNALLEDTAGSLWIATSNGLVRMTSNRFTRYTRADGLPSDSITSLSNLHGGICAETAAGPACMDGSASPPRFIATTTGVRTAPAQPLKTDLQVSTADHTQWSLTGGSLRASRDGQIANVTLPEGFSGGDILALYADREGNVWVGSENAGAAVVRTPPFTTIGKKDGLAADQVRSLWQDARGDLWFGTSGGLTRLHDGVFTSAVKRPDADVPGTQSLASDEIIALAGTNADDLWAGTPDGLSHIQGAKITTLTASDGLPDDNIRSLLEARDGSLWIGTTHGLAHLQKPAGKTAITAANIHTYTTADGLGSDVIGALLEDTDGSIWVGTRAGLSHVRGGTISGPGQAGTAIITALGKDAGGTLWVGTAGGGLYGTSGAGLLPDTIYSVLDDGRGEIWLSSPDGIYRVAASALHQLAEHGAGAMQSAITHYDVADGLRINDCGSGGHPEAIRTADGHLLFATSKGVSVVNAAEPALRQAAPPVVLESITVDDANATEDAAPDAPPDQEAQRSLHVAAGHER